MPQKKSRHLSITVALALVLSGGSYLSSIASPLGMSGDRLPAVADTASRKRPQQGQRIFLEHADLLSYDASLQPGVQRLVGSVRFRHGNATMTCDSAYLNEDAQLFEAFGDVHMVQGDTVHMYSRYLFYDGISKLARLRRNVHLANKTTDLYTDSLDYDRIADIAYYFEGGTVTDAQNTLTSDYGQFRPATNDAEFRYNVHLTNDKTDMTTEHLFYNTHTRIGSYQGQTLIKSDSGQITSQRGVYDVSKDIGILLDRSTVVSGSKTLIGDSIYYDGATKFGEAFGRMEISDTAQRAQLFGDYGYFDDKRRYAFATSRAFAVDYSQPDTLYVAADTLELISLPLRNQGLLDSIRALPPAESRPDTMERHLRGYRHVRVFRNDAQAIADSMSYISVDSMLSLYGKPFMWRENRQLSGDTTLIFFKNNKVNQADVMGSVLAVEHIDSVNYYNQIAGERLRAYMQDSTFREIDMQGNVESIFYMKENKGTEYTGLNRMTSATMHVYLDSGQVKKTIWTGPVNGKAYPLSMSETPEVNRLKQFIWAADKRPMRKEDITRLTDSIGSGDIPSVPLSDLTRFSGAQAQLRAYKPFDEAKETEDKKLRDLLTQHHQLTIEDYRKRYPYVLRSAEGVTAISIINDLISPSWVRKLSSDSDKHASSNISLFTGIPEKRNSTSE